MVKSCRVFCGIVAIAAVGCSAPSKSSTGIGETTSTKQALTTANGLAQNGLTTNGLWANGLWANGLWANGLWANGLWANGLWANGLWANGLWANGLWANGLWANGLWANGLRANGLDRRRRGSRKHPPQQRVRAPVAPIHLLMRDARDDLRHDARPNGGALACSPSSGGPKCDDGYTCSPQGTCVIQLTGSVGVGVNADGSTWGASGTCDESCQRWVSACVLARTNAYGVHVEISMRAPADAPQAKTALSASDYERARCPAGSEGDIHCGYTLREGAYYGNLFATTPVLPDGTPSPAPPPIPPATTYSGQAVGLIAQTPTFNACAGPASNIPEITKRFCSSQGDQSVINVPGVCLVTGTEAGTCEGEDTNPTGPTFGASLVRRRRRRIQDCYTSTDPTQTRTRYEQVITVYLKTPLAVCGNAVCEDGESDASQTTYCPSDCHPGTWAKPFDPTFESGDSQVAPLRSRPVSINSGCPRWHPTIRLSWWVIRSATSTSEESSFQRARDTASLSNIIPMAVTHGRAGVSDSTTT